MPRLNDILPEILRMRHHFTVQQINLLCGSYISEENLGEKTGILALTGELLRIIDAFNAADIQCIPLKGPVLSYRLYGDPTIRNFSDLDILVDVFIIHKAISVMEGLGYIIEDHTWPARKLQQKRLVRYAHHLNYIHPVLRSRVELHWQLTNAPAISTRALRTIVQNNLARIDFFGREPAVMRDEMNILYLVIHGGLHHWIWLKWLADVNQYLKVHSIDRDYFLKLTASMKAGRLVALCNALLTEYFRGDPLLPCVATAPAWLIRYSKMRIDGNDSSGLGSSMTLLQDLRFLLVAYPGFRNKIRPVVRVIGHSILYGRIKRFFSYKSWKINNED